MGQVEFIIGRTGTGKTNRILNEITKNCTDNPFGAPIFMVTPEQMTFHTEYQLLLMNPARSMVRANVTSFTRLAQRILQEVGGLARYHLDEVGKAMLLQKIMLAEQDDLGVFAKYVKKPGFIKKMDELFSEFKNYQLNAGELKLKVEQTDLGTKTKQKIMVLANLYDLFNEVTLTQYLTTEDYFALLTNLIAESSLLQRSEIYIDGYHTFNAAERAIITQLAHHAQKVTIVLTADEFSQHNLWQTTAQTLTKLYEELKHLKPSILPITTSVIRAESNQVINHIESHFMQGGRPFEKKGGGNQIRFLSAPSRRLEIEAVATRIHELAYSEGVAFSNIAVYTSNPVMDQHLYDNVFAKYEIPHFLDAKVRMLTHPVINLLHKVFTIYETNWRTSAVFSVLKSGLFVDVSDVASGINYQELVVKNLEAVDQLENYVIAHNIWKNDWLAGNFEGAEIARPLIEFGETLAKATTVVQFGTAIFTFLEQLDIPKKLQLMINQTETSGDLQAKKQHEQVWSKLLTVLEQLVEVAGDDPLGLTDFSQIFKTGLEQLNFATVPPVLDAVQIGDITRSRYQLVPNFTDLATYGIEHVFIVGVNDGELPSVPIEASLISEKERQILASLEIELAPSLMQSQQDEIFSLYTILAGATKTITLSYSTENAGLPSYIFNHVKQMFLASAVEEYQTNDPHTKPTTKRVLFDQVLVNSRSNQHQSDYYQSVIEYFAKSDRSQHQLLTRALGYANQVEPLSKSQALATYGTEIEASVSRLEQFNNCQFAHFMRYGLKLRERELFQLEVSDIGTLFHEALKHVSLLLQQEKRGFATLDDREVKNLAKLGVDAVLGKEKAFLILKSSSRMKQLTFKLQAVVEKTIMALATQGKRSEFKESYFEMRFGKNQAIKTKPRQIGDVLLSLTGTIDRIDTGIATDGKRYLRVVDYKSSKRALELDAVYHGLSLQILTYLDVAITNLANDFTNAGALYFHVHNPYSQVNEEILTTDNQTLVSKLNVVQSADYRMDGYLPANHEVATMSDILLADGSATRSDVVPVTFKKDGTFAAIGNRTLQPEDFDLLRTYANEKIDESVVLMTDGATQINPASHKGKSACDWCDFRAVCSFDNVHNQRRNLAKMKDDVALSKMKDEQK